MTKDGNKFGITDGNIKNGQTVEEACDDILKAIYLKRFKVVIGSFKYYIFPKLVNFSETLYTTYLGIYYKSQIKTLEAARKGV